MDAIRSWLYIGKYRDTLNRPLLDTHAISAILQFAEYTHYPHITHLYLPVEDGHPLAPAFLAHGMSFVRQSFLYGQPLLIACGAGISRSATFATAALKEIESLPLLQAFQLVHRAHPTALPHPLLWESLCQYFGEEVPIIEMIRCLQIP